MTGRATQAQGRRRRAGGRRLDDRLVAALVFLAATAWHLAVARRALGDRADLAFFGADTARVLRHMAVRGPMLDRGQFHPLFPLLTQPPVRALMALGLGRVASGQVVMAAYGGVLAAAVYGTGRRRRLPVGSALAPAALAAVAGASVVFGAVPETFGVSAALASVVVFLAAGWQRPPRLVESAGALVLGGAAVVTGALVPVVAVWRAEPSWSRRIAAAGAALGAFVGLLAIQAIVIGTRFHLTADGEDAFVRHDRLAGAGDSLRTLLASGWSLPAPRLVGGVVTVDGAAGPGDALGLAALVLLAVLWALTALGVWWQRQDRLVPVLLVGIVAHVVLFALYGDEAFLYAVLVVPLVLGLVIVAASGTLRRPVVLACWLLVPVLAVVNVGALDDAARLVGA